MCSLWTPLSSSASADSRAALLSASFIWGTDSPVSVASFTTAVPRSSSTSAGTTSLFSARVREAMSPGRRSSVLIWTHLPPRRA